MSNYIDGRTNKKYHCIDCGKNIVPQTAIYGQGRCQSCAVKHLCKLGILNPTGKKSSNFGKRPSNKTRRKMSKSHGGRGIFKHERLPKCVDCGKELGDYRSERCLSCSTKNQHSKNAFNYRRKINKPESLLKKLLNKTLPNEYRFVGDNKIVIGSFNPDFVNVKGEKKIIELYGDYWHKREEVIERDIRRIKVYKNHGYKTLIIWEKELKNLDKVKTKILKF